MGIVRTTVGNILPERWCKSKSNSNSIWGTVFGSLAAGMIVAIIQYIIAWNDYKQTEKLKELRLIEVLLNRAKRISRGDPVSLLYNKNLTYSNKVTMIVVAE